MIQQVPVTQEAMEVLKQLMLAPNEGVMYAKFVLVTQPTLTAGQTQAKISEAPQVILLGDLEEIKAQLSTWMGEAVAKYKEAK